MGHPDSTWLMGKLISGIHLILALAFFGSLTWLVFDLGWLSTGQEALSYVALVVIAAILAVGMAWSHIWRQLSGQVDVDEDHRHD
jgi:Na+/melibiose symporter-like transporter